MRPMRFVIAFVLCLAASCGWTSAGNEAVGQVKKVIKKTPILCPDYTVVDISLGVMRNGVGSVSHEDLELVAEDPKDIDLLKTASITGEIVKFSYDVKRVALCWPDDRLTHAEIDMPTPPPAPDAGTAEAPR